MSYSTLSEFKSMYQEQANNFKDESIIMALEQSSSEIDSYLATRLVLPLIQPPSIVALWCNYIAMYNLSLDIGAGYSEEKRIRYEDCIKALAKVAKGEIIIKEESPSVSPSEPEKAPGIMEFSVDKALFSKGGF